MLPAAASKIADRVQDILRIRQQLETVGGERETARRAREQAQVQLVLEALQLQADGGLGEMQQLRGARQAAFARHRDERADVLKVVDATA